MTRNQMSLYKLLVNFEDQGQDNLAMAMSVQHNLMVYGYMLDEEAFNQLKRTHASNIKVFLDESLECLKEYLGGKHSYESLYRNFPNDVMSMSQAELFYTQIAHYWGQQKFLSYGELPIQAFESVEYKIIKGTSPEGILDIYRLLAGAGQSLTPMDIKVLKYFATTKDLPVVPVPFKENLAVLASALPGFKVQTVVDVLRVAVAMSGGDPSLPPVPKRLKIKGAKYEEVEAEREKFKFKLDTLQRDRVMDLFENSNLSTSDLNQGSRYGRFIRLAEVLHVQEYKTTHPKTVHAFHVLRNQKRKGKPDGVAKIRTWHSQVESQFKVGFKEGLEKLSERPGEFVRRLDFLVRTNMGDENKDNMDLILLTLSRVGEGSSNKVLFEVYTHFENRSSVVTGRSVFLKGARSKTMLPDLPAIKPAIIESIQDTIINCIKGKLSALPSLTDCYIDPELKKIPLPTNMRSLSESLTPIIRGQRIPLVGADKTIRSFVHWFDDHGCEDLDLHGFIFSETYSESFGYNGRRIESYGCYSGDVRCRKGACAEYVDIDIEKALAAGWKYFAPVVHNFQDRPLSSMKDCVAGNMMREFPQANSSWVPDTITNAMKLTSSSKYCMIGVYDLEAREYIHLDLDWTKQGSMNPSDAKSLMKVMTDYIEEPKLSVYDLLRWHVESRGKLASKDTATDHFMFDDFKSDYTMILPWMGI
jgi:hypothetical protein